IGDHGAGARQAGEQALGLEVAVRGDHGVAVDAELAGQRARAGQHVAGGELAGADVVGDRVGDLGEQRRGEAAVRRWEVEGGARHTGGASLSELDVVNPPESYHGGGMMRSTGSLRMRPAAAGVAEAAPASSPASREGMGGASAETRGGANA